MNTSFQDEYAGLSDQELLNIAADKNDLLEEAAFALDSELNKRGLSYEQATQFKSETELPRSETEHKPSKSKYLTENFRAYWGLLITLGVAILYLLIVPKQFRIPDEWGEPALVALLGTAMPPFGMRLWVRKQVVFWLALLVSSTVQLLLVHSLLLQFPNPSRGTGKLIWVASLFAGYAVGWVVYVALRALGMESKD